MPELNHLYTIRGEELKGNYETVYPRPMLKRESFYSLDGEWMLSVKGTDNKILVPFCPESLLSGVNEIFPYGELLCYKKEFILPDGFINQRVLLNFGAVDQKCVIFLNDKKVGQHTGGYTPFTLDITDFLIDKNILTVLVTDNLNEKILPYGKQKYKRGGMWYTPVSGIWQSVWIESVPKDYVKDLRVDVTLDTAIIDFSGIDDGEVLLEDKIYPVIDGKAVIKLDNPVNWSPENPYLYEYTAVCGEDKITSYFALRTLEIRDNKLLLNGKPYFFHGVLDQGYFSDGIYTPASVLEYKDDILKMKSLGFNMIRKHIKIEPQIFYYYCDKYGMAVFQDMVNNGKYSFIKDTALPTVGFVRKNDNNIHKNSDTRQAFINGMEETVKVLYNHPSIVQWTIFNEGWGQFCADEMYDKLKTLDNTRFIDSASGWFKADNNDFDSRHIYFKDIKIKESHKPLFISEFGGYSCKFIDHSFNKNKTYGYGKFKSREEFVKAFCNLYENQVIPAKEKGLCATVYTQLSDVEDETNGLLTYDRRVLKVKPEEFLPISEKLKNMD